MCHTKFTLSTFYISIFYIFSSIHNPLERDHIIAICEKLVITKTANAHDIAVITPYRQQVNLLRQELKKLLELEHIDVDTIDGFQGREKRIVILSCVRGSSQQGTIGFLSNPQRMNVALTRAKDALIIIAKCSSIEVIQLFRYVLCITF